MIAKTYRYSFFSKCYNCLSNLSPVLNHKLNSKKLHSSTTSYAKMFMENENNYAYSIMQNNGYAIGFNFRKEKFQAIPEEQFRNIMKKNWSKETPQTILQLFSTLGEYCSQHNICISSEQFDDYIDTLTDCIKMATDEELKSIFYDLSKWPETESIKTRNYIEVWVALDDECYKRIKNWSKDDMLSYISLFYMLNVTRLSEFCHKCLLKLTNKPKNLTKSQVVQVLFYIGIARKSPPDVQYVEQYIEEIFSQFSVDELAIIAMGLFKSKTPIRSMTLASLIIDRVVMNCNQIHEVSLASLLKIIRYSVKRTNNDKIYDLLDCLQHETSRLSVMCNVQIALVGTTNLTLHENCLTKIADTTILSLSDARLKDFERLVLTYGVFNFKPKIKVCYFSKIIDELRKPERAEEINKHGRSFSCCVAFFSLLGIYPFDLMNKVLSPAFLKNTYGDNYYQYGREILTIHNIAKIIANNQIVSPLTDNQVKMLSKKYTDYAPDESYEKRYNLSEKMFLDVIRLLWHMRGGKNFAIGHHILTHHQRGDIIICDSRESLPMPVDKDFLETNFGLVTGPPDNNIWMALIIAGKNTMIHKTNTPTGPFAAKIRELNTLGYYAAVVSWNIYNNLKSNDEKMEYLNTLIKEAVNIKL